MENIGLNSKQLAPNYRWKNGVVDLEELAKQVTINTNNIKILQTDITELTNKVNTNTTNITNLQQDLIDLSKRVTVNENNISSLKVDIEAISAQVNQNTTNISKIQSDLTDLTKQVNTNTTKIAQIQSDIDILKAKLKNSIFLENLKMVSLLIPENTDGSEQHFELDLGSEVNESDIKFLSTWIAYAGGIQPTYFRDIKQVGFYYNYVNANERSYIELSFYPAEVKSSKFIKNWSAGSLDFGILYTSFDNLPT